MNPVIRVFVLFALVCFSPMWASAEELAVNTSDSSPLTIFGIIFFGLFVLFSFVNRIIAARRKSESLVNHTLKHSN